MLELHFNSISEMEPGQKWQKLFNTHWSAYRTWFESKGVSNTPDLNTCQAQLKKYMPELVPIYEKLCKLAGNDKVAHRFLTGWQPPAYISGCSQAVWQDEPQLVRNYDYHPHLSEGTLFHSAWNGKQVIATGDCLWGAVDGMNEDGLVVSLTFGGRKAVGEGFGIPFIIRYVLETCSTVDEAVEVLQRVPSHQSYNVMVLNKPGDFRTVQIAPDKEPKVTRAQASTNHQGEIDWPEHALFSKTVEREHFLLEQLKVPNQNQEGMAQAFLQEPLFNTRYKEGFGTVYTAVYRPAEMVMELRWQDETLRQSFANFQEGITKITYGEKVLETVPTYSSENYQPAKYEMPESTDYWVEYGKAWASSEPSVLAKYVAKTIADVMGISESAQYEDLLENFTSESKKRGQIPWEMLADFWSRAGRS